MLHLAVLQQVAYSGGSIWRHAQSAPRTSDFLLLQLDHDLLCSFCRRRRRHIERARIVVESAAVLLIWNRLSQLNHTQRLHPTTTSFIAPTEEFLLILLVVVAIARFGGEVVVRLVVEHQRGGQRGDSFGLLLVQLGLLVNRFYPFVQLVQPNLGLFLHLFLPPFHVAWAHAPAPDHIWFCLALLGQHLMQLVLLWINL